jgi:hypothetical protein
MILPDETKAQDEKKPQDNKGKANTKAPGGIASTPFQFSLPAYVCPS